MKFGVVVFPGSNCDRDMHWAIGQDLDQEVEYLWHKQDTLSGYTSEDCILIPGGFSYGDYLRCGAIAIHSPIMKAVIKFAHEGGKVLGVCNGFQILCESKLLPGALLANSNQKFVCKNSYIKADNGENPLTKDLADKALKIPIAHGEGRYFVAEDELASMEENGQILFRYCGSDGELSDAHNPNGSLGHIAGVSNKAKNVFGMMPHPERASNAMLANEDGLLILKNLLN